MTVHPDADNEQVDDAGAEPAFDIGRTAGRLEDQLCFALYAATNAVTRAYRPMLSQMGLTYPQFLVLMILWEHHSRTVGQIAAGLNLATHAISPIVDRLETAGLVSRRADETDRRVVHVDLTDAGAKLEPAGAEVQEALRCQTRFTNDEIVRLRTDLIELVDRMRADD